MTRAVIYGALKGIVSPEVLLNDGFIRPIHLIVPEGSLLNPRFPAAVGGRAALFFRAYDMVFRTLAKAVPEKMPVPGEGGDVLHFTGQKADGQPFALMDISLVAGVAGRRKTVSMG